MSELEYNPTELLICTSSRMMPNKTTALLSSCVGFSSANQGDDVAGDTIGYLGG